VTSGADQATTLEQDPKATNFVPKNIKKIKIKGVLDNSCTSFIPKFFIEILANILSIYVFLPRRG
jgi:16S rRNA G966 N2-methylase RsmD